MYTNLDLTSGDADNDGICDLIISYGASDTDYSRGRPLQDLEDTLKANRERCVGLAANMIGYRNSADTLRRSSSMSAIILRGS